MMVFLAGNFESCGFFSRELKKKTSYKWWFLVKPDNMCVFSEGDLEYELFI